MDSVETGIIRRPLSKLHIITGNSCDYSSCYLITYLSFGRPSIRWLNVRGR